MFFDITFHIIFGENDYSKFDKVYYKNPHDSSAPILSDLKPTILKLMDDGMKQGMKPLFIFFPKLMKKGVGSQKYLHQNAARVIESLKNFASNNSQINENSILNQLKPLNSTPEQFDQLIKNLLVFLLAGVDTVSHTLTSILYFIEEHPENLKILKEEFSRVFNSDLK